MNARRLCAYCRCEAEGNFSVHSKRTLTGWADEESPVVWLCDAHGDYSLPTLPEIWRNIELFSPLPDACFVDNIPDVTVFYPTGWTIQSKGMWLVQHLALANNTRKSVHYHEGEQAVAEFWFEKEKP